jgi:outer membrane protein assembly factor BamA
MQTYFPVTANFNGSIKWIGKGIHMFSTPVPKSRYEWFGGTASLRGYREQEFSAPQFQVASLEMGYQAKGSVQTKLFIDMGSDRLNILATNWIGYGIGLSQVNEHSIIRVEYALSNHSISKGKLHIKWISRL